MISDLEVDLSSKKRITVLLEDDSNWKNSILNNGTHITVSNETGVIQERQVFQFSAAVNAPFPHDLEVRVTWKSLDGIDSSPIKPQLSRGLHIFASQSVQELPYVDYDGFIESPLGKIWYSEEMNTTMLEKWLPSSVLNMLDYGNADFDVYISDELELNRYYNLSPADRLSITGKPGTKTETGIFHVDTQDDVDINLSGIRCNWDAESGALDKCQKTFLFYHPSHVHGPSTSNVTITLAAPVGLHPTVKIDLASYTSLEQCQFYTYLTLPRHLFIDEFQSNPIFVFGEHDLELPEYKVRSAFGSVSLYPLTPGKVNEIIVHSRYVEPDSNHDKYSSVTFTPHVFYACDTHDEALAESPFYSRRLGYESFFTADTRFYHLNSTTLKVEIPKLDSSNNFVIQLSTAFVLFLSALYLIRRIFK